jgi:ASC-1-like (ASCH) protein
MKKRRTRTASAAELKQLKPKYKTFKVFPGPLPEEDLQFIGPDEPVAYEIGGITRRTTAGKIAEAVANGKRLEPMKNKPIEPEDLPPYEPPTSYSFELKPTDVFNITVDGRELNMSGQTLREAFEARIAHDENRFHKAMDTFTDFKRFLVNMNDEVVLVVPNKAVIRIKGHEMVDAIEQKDQVENLREELEALTNWKNGAVDVLKRWNDVQDYLMKKGDGKMWGRNVSEIALERLKDYDNLLATMNKTAVKSAINEREPTPEEMVEGFLRQLEGRENLYPFVLEAINSRLLTQLERVASMASETSAIARKRFEESVLILQRVSPPNKH